MSDDPDDHIREESPFNSVPPTILALGLIMLAVELAFALGARGLVGGSEAVGWRSLAVPGR